MGMVVALPTLQRDLADLDFTAERLANEMNLSRSSIQRRLHGGEWTWNEFNHLAGLAVHLNPTFGWRYAPAWVGLPPFPEDADWHPAACMLDARSSAREFLDIIDGASSPGNWDDQKRAEVVKRGWQLVKDLLRFLLSLAVKH